MDIRLSISVIGPDDELEKNGYCYGLFGRDLEMPFVPMAGLIVDMPVVEGDGGRSSERYKSLAEIYPAITGLFEVSSVIYYMGRDKCRVELKPVITSTIDQFKAANALLEEYFGFSSML